MTLSLSNMPIKEAGVPIGDTGYVWDVYEDSVKMSTYLLAFVVSDFDHRTSDPLPNGVEFSIWSREEALSQTEWASKIGPEVLAYYEQYFNISFPLPKMDMIAIPNFISGKKLSSRCRGHKDTAHGTHSLCIALCLYGAYNRSCPCMKATLMP